MVLTWISEKGAKWVIYIFGAGILVGLLSLGQTNLDSDRMPPVAKVDGYDIPAAQFRQAYDGALAQYSSGNLREEDRAQIRNQVLDQLIRSYLTRQQMETARIRATVTEMKEDLLNNPPEEWKSADIFQTDSVFDEAKWRRFVSSDSVYDQQFMLSYELYLKNEKIPSMQLQAFVAAGYHATDAEARLTALRRNNKMSVEAVIAPMELFPVLPESISDEELQEGYRAAPDSFWAPVRMARFELAALRVIPSEADEEDGKKMLDWIAGQLEGEMSFEELAAAHSADEGSAQNGGSLGGYQPLDRWVAPFAEAARALQPGELSPPVRTPFGWHLIKCNGVREGSDGVTEADLSHILVKISAGNKTVDSLRNVLQDISDRVTDKRVPFAEAVAAAGLEVISTPWLQRGENVPGIGAVHGLASYGFADKLKSPLSKISEGDEWMVLARRVGLLDAGERDFSLAESLLRTRLAEQKQIAAATSYLEEKMKEWGGEIDSVKVNGDEKLRWSSAAGVGVEGYVSGLGVDSPLLRSAWKAGIGVWSEVLPAEHAAVAFRVTDKSSADLDGIDASLPMILAGTQQSGTQAVVNDWLRSLEAGAKIEKNLDLYFSE